MKTLHELDWPRRTDRLELRPAREADAAEVWSWQRLPAVTEWMPRLATDQEAFTAHFVSHLDVTAVASLAGRIVASAKIAVSDAWAQAEVAEQARGQLCELGWALDPSLHGQGLGTELAAELLATAFDGLGVRRVVAYCFADNIPSWKVMEKIGMRREAHLKAESLHRSGAWVDGLAYGLLADEWRTAH